MEEKNVCGRVVKCLGGLYEILPEADSRLPRISCRARGAFRKRDIRVLVGDIVEVSVADETVGVAIETVCERKNALIRPPLANLDCLFAVIAAAHPSPSLETLDKLIAIAEHNGIEVCVIITKADVDAEAAERYAEIYTRAGFKCFTLSSISGEGCAEVAHYIEERVRDGVCAAIAGASGVGKSTLLNFLFPTLSLATGEISKKIERGRHTTRHVELYPINEEEGSCGFFADTPGFSMLDFAHFDFFALVDLPDTFRDFEPYMGSCKFLDCTHTREQDCAIVQAVKRGEVAQTRHESYVTLYDTLKAKKNY